jgi:heptosyltransferase-2
LTTDQTVIICTPNWLGDCVMAMPAIQAFCRRFDPRRLVVVTKPGLLPLWSHHPDVDACLTLFPGVRGLRAASRSVGLEHPKAAYVLPHSFRAAFVPLLARVPQRVGQRGHPPQCLLTHAVAPPSEPERSHQAWEYMSMLGVAEAGVSLPAADLRLPESIRDDMRVRCGATDGAPLVGVLPGAAHGPSKRWPVEHFAAAVERVVRQSGARTVVLGSEAEQDAAARVAVAGGDRAVNLAGHTSLPELAAALAQCAVVLCNDSGGMHLAAAMGTPVVAIFGITDPRKTGPLGKGHRLVLLEEVQRSRDLDRHSARAQRVLAAIRPDRVASEVLAVLSAGRPT